MLKIYGVPISVHTRKVLHAVRAKQFEHELVPVAPVIAATLPPTWATLTPTGKIPVLVDGDLVLFDSAAICAYLERLRPSPALYPDAAADRARVECLERYAGDVLFRDVVHPLFRELFVQPRVNGAATDDEAVRHVRESVAPRVFDYLEGSVGLGFLVGARMSMADVAIASNLITFGYLGFTLDGARHPRLSAWFARVLADPVMRETVRAEGPAVASMGLDARVWETMAN